MSLLLLPALDITTTPTSLKSSYKSTFTSLLPRILPQNKSSTTRLDIALILSPSYPFSTRCRSTLFAPIQNLLKQTYSLITSVASQQDIDLDFPGGIDIRVFILEVRVDQLHKRLIGKQPLSGPIVDIDTLVLSDRGYKTIFSVEGEAGESNLKQFLTTWGTRLNDEPPTIARLPSGPAIVHLRGNQASNLEDGPVTDHNSVAVGGTFDHLHIGHKLLLSATVLAADSSPTTPRLITIGITGDELLVNKKYGTHVESWSTRQERTAEFVDSILAFYTRKTSANELRTTEYIDQPGPNGKIVRVTYKSPPSIEDGDVVINYTQISDPFGPTITDPDISAIVISAETRAGGKAVNDKRKEKGWKELEVFEVDILDASVGADDEQESESKKESFESKISSTEIRRRLQERTQEHL